MSLGLKLSLVLLALWLQGGDSYSFMGRGIVANRRSPFTSSLRLQSTSSPTKIDLSNQSFLESLPTLTRKDTVSDLIGGSPMARASSKDTVYSAVATMNRFNKGGILIFDENDKLAGIFTERDFVTKILDAQRQSTETTVESVMTPVSKMVFGNFDGSLNECRQLMVEKNIRHLPIKDSSGTVVGMISLGEIIKSLQQDDLIRSTARFSGNTLEQIAEQARNEANELALASGEEGKREDVLRVGYVVMAIAILGGLLQGDWVHSHEYLALIGTFIVGYIGIVFEASFEFNKAGIALLMSTALWVIFADSSSANGIADNVALHHLQEKVSEVSEVVFFILGAMAIVEIVDSHKGFKVVTDKISANSKRGLMWVIGIITFFMSAILDNLTTTIVMVSLAKKLLPDPEDRKLFGAMIVIAANAGGAWTPIGDVTTTMLWINGQISAFPTITNLFFPSLLSTVVSIFALEKYIPANEPVPVKETKDSKLAPRGQLVFTTGILGLLSVPVFKSFTGLPPYLGMLAALGVMWSLTDAIHAGEENRESLTAPAALKKIDTSGVLFFLGILLSVGALDSAGILRSLAELLDKNIPSESLIAVLIGIASSLIDNVPLVAATMGMYDLSKVPMDSSLWQLIAFCAGTGGSLLVIGSAAGVALMGLEKVDFVWYAKKITLPAFAGYGAGIAAYLAQQNLFHTLPALPGITL